jgi:hypothetical protein
MAAEVITRFKLETTQFDSKLRDAAKGLKEYTHQAELGGKSFTDFSQKSIEAARSLGTIASGANNAKDKVKDLVGAYNDAANAYNKLSQEQQQSDFGKALAQSIGQLSDRLKEAKQELYGLGNAVDKVKSGGLFGEGGLTGMLAVTGGDLLASGLSKLGSELADTIQQSIELARQGEGVRLAFDRLNQPGLLDKLKEATHGTVSEVELMKAAIKFENFKLPLEDLGTYLAFAQQKAQDTGDSVDNMVTSIVNGLGRQSVQILDNLGISASEIRDRMKEGGDMTQVVAQIIREEMTKAGDYVETAATRAARAAADAANEMEKLGQKAGPVAEEWSKTWNSIKMGCIEVLNWGLTPIVDSIKDIRELLSGEYTLKIRADIPNLADGPISPFNDKPGTDHKVTAPGGYVVVTDKNGKQIGAKHFDSFDNGAVDTWKQTLSTKSGRSGSQTDPTAKIQNSWDKTFATSVLNADKMKSDAKDMLSPYQMMLPEIKKNILDIKDADLGGALANIGNEKVVKEIKDMNNALAQQKMAFNMSAQAASNFGSALSAMEDPSAKAAGTVIQAIANIMLGFSSAAAQASSMGPYGWIAYLAAGLGAAATTISTIHSLTGYAEGGMIKGNSYSGDNIGGLVDGSQFVGLNAGEIVLNQAQTSNVANALKGGSMSNMHLTARLDGKDLLLSIDRTGQTMGYGQLVFFK